MDVKYLFFLYTYVMLLLHLPDEIIEHIKSFMPYHTTQVICKKLRRPFTKQILYTSIPDLEQMTSPDNKLLHKYSPIKYITSPDIVYAAKYNRIDILENYIDKLDNDILVYAVRYNQLDAVNFITNHITPTDIDYLIYLSARNNNLTMLKKFLPYPNVREAALIWAIKYQNKEMIDVLLQYITSVSNNTLCLLLYDICLFNRLLPYSNDFFDPVYTAIDNRSVKMLHLCYKLMDDDHVLYIVEKNRIKLMRYLIARRHTMPDNIMNIILEHGSFDMFKLLKKYMPHMTLSEYSLEYVMMTKDVNVFKYFINKDTLTYDIMKYIKYVKIFEALLPIIDLDAYMLYAIKHIHKNMHLLINILPAIKKTYIKWACKYNNMYACNHLLKQATSEMVISCFPYLLRVPLSSLLECRRSELSLLACKMRNVKFMKKIIKVNISIHPDCMYIARKLHDKQMIGVIRPYC